MGKIESSAELSPDGVYRYRLDRRWDNSLPRMVFLMLNPSTADASSDDPTLRRCISFARSLGHGSLSVVNLYALRTPNPRELRDHPDPVGPLNDRYIAETVRDADLVVAGWGNNAWDPRRVDQVRSLLPGPLHALGVTKGGNPGHPLYLKGDSQLVKWADAVSASAGGDALGEIRSLTRQIHALEARRDLLAEAARRDGSIPASELELALSNE